MSGPNFVFFLVDDLGWRDLACCGSDFYRTPGIDRLSDEGMRFTDAYAAAPVCSPTRASIMTGKYPARMDTTDWFGGDKAGKLLPAEHIHNLPSGETILAEALKEAGYKTCYIGKWHLGGEGHWPEDHGFDINIGGWTAGSPGSYFPPYNNPKLPDGPDGEYLTDRLTDEAIGFLDSHDGGPFALFLAHYAVHVPLQAREDIVEKYRQKAASLGDRGPEFFRSDGVKQRRIQGHPVYAAMIESVDRGVARVTDKLKQMRLEENTVVVFTSDNGGLSTAQGWPTTNLPLRTGKGWPYEGGIRVPLIVRFPPLVAPGSVTDAAVISNDFYPTMLELASLKARPRQHCDAASMADILKGQRPTGAQRPLFWHYPHYSDQGCTPAGAVRAGRWKLIEFFEDFRLELYDLHEDIGEQNDLAGAMPQKAAELKNMLHQWRREVDARMPRAAK